MADSALIEAILRAERGLVDADLGGGVIKQRVASTGQGRSGGYRTLILFRQGWSDEDMDRLVSAGALTEIEHGQDDDG